MWPFTRKKTVSYPQEKISFLTKLADAHKGNKTRRGGTAYASIVEAMQSGYANFAGKTAFDAALPTIKRGFGNSAGDVTLNDALLGWYTEQSFIGYHLCAILSQNWLIDKACSMPARDAVRHGFEVTFGGIEDEAVQSEVMDDVAKASKNYDLQKHMIEFIRMGRIYGIRHVMFDLDVNDRKAFYGNPFNPDALSDKVKYRGMIQVDANWIVPILKDGAVANPADPGFYEPEWWEIGDLRVHKSHLCIFRNAEVPDLLKPMYRFGGVSVPQRIMERVYSAERTANEGPQLAMSKRLTVWKMELSDVFANQAGFEELMNSWIEYRDNFGVKISDIQDDVQQFETSLADLDDTIMTQYQLVAAGANVPATKLLGTTPKGFNSTGEHETKSYHEELETIQSNDLEPLVERHLLILSRCTLAKAHGLDPSALDVSIDWNPVDSPSALDYATINKTQAETDNILSMAGAIDGMDIRRRISNDKNSGYTDLPEPEPDDLDNDETDQTAPPPPFGASEPDSQERA